MYLRIIPKQSKSRRPLTLYSVLAPNILLFAHAAYTLPISQPPHLQHGSPDGVIHGLIS